MDDIRAPRPGGLGQTPRPRPRPVTDIAGVQPRGAAPHANAMHGSTESTADMPASDAVAVTPSMPMPANAPAGGNDAVSTSMQSAATAASTPASPAPAASASLLAEIEAQERADAEARVQQAPVTPRRMRHGFMPILIAVIVALGLVAGAGYAYLQNNKQAKQATTTQSTTKKAAAKTPATTKDVDDTTSAIDSSINKINQTTDVQETDLSDTTLGIQ